MAMGNDNIKGHFLGTLVRGFNLDFHSPLAEMSPLSDPICVIPYGMPVMLVANCYTPCTLVYLGCPSCHPNNSVKALQKIQSSDFNQNISHCFHTTLIFLDQLPEEECCSLYASSLMACIQINSVLTEFDK